jgi:hypothetical protein
MERISMKKIKELMSYYKLIVKQTTQQKNHLEALTAKDGSSYATKALIKSINESKIKSEKVIDYNALSLYKNDRKYDVNFGKPKATYME